MKKKFAFTLAEVLITLSILGVVAAITVPSLIKRQHRNEVETKLKKFVSTMENVIDTSQAENGPARTWRVTSVPSGWTVGHAMREKYIIPYLNITQDNYGKEDSLWTVTDPNGATRGWANNACTFCLKDGTCFSGYFTGVVGVSDINSEPGNYSSNQGGKYLLMDFVVDLNGSKGPNALGKDVFALQALETGGSGSSSFQIVGYYHDDPLRGTASKAIQTCKNGDGVMCAEWIKNNNWKIPKDYPWL